MQIGKQLKDARNQANLTQENVAEQLNVSRQTISNWENEKSYPDIISMIELSDLYSISLDHLLKGDKDMIEHLEESTNIVKSNKKLIRLITLNVFMVIVLLILAGVMPQKIYFQMSVFCFMIMSTSLLIAEIVRRI